MIFKYEPFVSNQMDTMFNGELFYKLCEKYGVEVSDKYNKPMIKEKDGTIRLLSDDDVLHLLDIPDGEIYLS